MTRRPEAGRFQTVTRGVALVAGALLFASASSAQRAEITDPRPTMRLVFEEIKKLVPASLDESTWDDPESRTRILHALDRLDRAAATLERHGSKRSAGFDELALSLGRDVRATREHFARGDYAEARFFLNGSLQNCVSCHVRLPASEDFPFAEELVSQVELDALDLRERAWLQVMVRQFDAALDAYEKLMADPDRPPAQLDANGVLVDYMNVALRVRADVPRARRAIDRLAARPDLPIYLRRRVATWRATCARLDAKALSSGRAPTVDRGVALARAGGALAQGPYGRDGLVQDLAAASQFVRFLEADRAAREATTRNRTPEERREISRAYYWLAVVESRSLDGFWINLSERHFEASVRVDPGGEFAERAYAQLEEIQALGFGGTSGEDLPADVWTLLRELEGLIENAPPATSR